MVCIFGMEEVDRKFVVDILLWIVCVSCLLVIKEFQYVFFVVFGNFELDLDMIYFEDDIWDVCGVYYIIQGYFRDCFFGFYVIIVQICISYLFLKVLE